MILYSLLLQPEQLNKIFELCGTPDELTWPGVSKIPWYNKFKPTRPMKKRIRELFRQLSFEATCLIYIVLFLSALFLVYGVLMVICYAVLIDMLWICWRKC